MLRRNVLLNIIKHFFFIIFYCSFSSCVFFSVFQGQVVKIVPYFFPSAFNHTWAVFRSRRFVSCLI